MLLPADAVEEIVGLRAAHARDEDEALDARRLGRIDLRLGAQPVDLLGRACSGFGLGLGLGLGIGVKARARVGVRSPRPYRPG